MGWGIWLKEHDCPLTTPIIERLEDDLRYEGDHKTAQLTREHAAFAVWCIHVLPFLRVCAKKEQRDRLAFCLLDAGKRHNDYLLLQAAASLDLRLSTDFIFKTSVNNPRLSVTLNRYAQRTREHKMQSVYESLSQVARHCDGMQEQLFLCWDSSKPAFDQGMTHNDICAVIPQTFRNQSAWINLLAVNTSRGNSKAAVDYFMQSISSVRNQPRTFNAFSKALEATLNSRQHNALSILRRRTAASLLRYVPSEVRLRLACDIGLRDNTTFVLHSVTATLRDFDHIETFDAVLDKLLHLNKNRRDRPIELMGNLLQVLALKALHPLATSYMRKRFAETIYAFAQHPHYELRGKALAWLGEWVRREKGLSEVDLWLQLLRILPPNEYAINIAQALMAPMGLERPPSFFNNRMGFFNLEDGSETGSLYDMNLWRTDME